MPTYDYVCDACEHAFELFQSVDDKVEKKCPECGKRKLRRLIGTGAAVIFKGSGFYTTDYRSESYKQRAEADRKSADTTKSATKETASDSGSAPSASPAVSGDSASKKTKAGKKNSDGASQSASKQDK